jgi:hypothetical protein
MERIMYGLSYVIYVGACVACILDVITYHPQIYI